MATNWSCYIKRLKRIIVIGSVRIVIRLTKQFTYWMKLMSRCQINKFQFAANNILNVRRGFRKVVYASRCCVTISGNHLCDGFTRRWLSVYNDKESEEGRFCLRSVSHRVIYPLSTTDCRICHAEPDA